MASSLIESIGGNFWNILNSQPPKKQERDRICVEITGNFVQGHVLSRIMFWNFRGRGIGSEETKLRVKKWINGKQELVLAKSWEEIGYEIGLGKWQYYRSLKELQTQGLIKVGLHGYNAHATKHIWLNRELVAKRYLEELEKYNELTQKRVEQREAEKEARRATLEKNRGFRWQ